VKTWFKSLSPKIKMRPKQNVSADFFVHCHHADFSHSASTEPTRLTLREVFCNLRIKSHFPRRKLLPHGFWMALYFPGMLTLALLVLPAVAAAGGATFNVRQFGAVGDGTHMDTASLQQAIDAAANAGGGTVLFPAGRYLSASLDLKSHVTLQLDEGATLLGSPHKSDYRNVNFYGLLLADNQQDIAVCGKGVIDGQGVLLAADTRRLWKEKKLPNAREGERPVIINFRNCTNVIVRDITLKDSASWVENYRDCTHLTVENIKVRSISVANNDGIDIDGCAHVVIRDCDIDSADDGICLKSDDRACEDVLV
jgi:polygalacturonase